MNCLYIFRRDLRLEDNTALLEALKTSNKVIPCFILDPRQIKENEYFSKNAYEFMIKSLKELDEKLRSKGSQLYVFKEKPEEVIGKLKNKISKVIVTQDYTPFSMERDKKIKTKCEELNISFQSFEDYLLNPVEKIKKGNGEPYTVFTPYYKSALKYKIRKPKPNKHINYFKEKLDTVKIPEIEKNPYLYKKGGRAEALELLKENYFYYKEKRDIPSINGTTGLSPHHKFGTISIRESYEAFKGNESLIRELYFRDFFTQLCYHHPYVFKENFQRKYNSLEWEDDDEKFKAWCEGRTGFPIVDAGMRELNTTGYMHNRIRMIVASFLVKHLLINWKRGERYFANKLVDYDPCVNNANWQWAASTGADAQPYFRIFNPWRQQERFDPECKYIKKWVPELNNLTAKKIHSLKDKPVEEYHKPIVEHEEARKKALNFFKTV